MTISPQTGISGSNGICGTLTGISDAGGISSQGGNTPPAPAYTTYEDVPGGFQFSNGNLTATHGVGGQWGSAFSILSMTSGRWYWEQAGSAVYSIAGVGTAAAKGFEYAGQTADSWGLYSAGLALHSGSNWSAGASFGPSDTVGIALDLDGNTVDFYVNNTLRYSFDISSRGASPIFAMSSLYQFGNTVTANFGASALVYTPPTGYNAGFYS